MAGRIVSNSPLVRLLTAATLWLAAALERVDGATRRWVSGSLIGRFVEPLAEKAAHSDLLRWLLGLGGPDRGMERSLIGRALTGLFERIAGRLSRSADRVERSALGRWWQGSLLARLATYEVGVTFVLFFVPLSHTITWFLPRPVKYAAEAALLLMLGRLVLELITGRRKLVWSNLDGPVFVFISIGVISAALNQNSVVQSVFGLRAMFQYYVLAVVVSNAGFSRDTIRRLLTGLAALTTLIGAFGVYQWLVNWEIPREWLDVTETHIKTRAFGTMGNPNTFGAYLAIVAAPLIAVLTVKTVSPMRRLGAVLALPMILGGLVLSFSRSAMIALAAAMVILGIAKDRRIVALVLLAACALPVAAPTIAVRIAQGFSSAYVSKSSAGGRIDWWNKAIQVAHEINPLFGVGPGQYGGAAANYFGTKAYPLVGLPPRFPLWVDSQLYQYVAEVGYLGLIAFFWVLLTFFRCARELHRKGDEMTGALAIGFAGSVFGTLLFSLFASIWEVQPISSILWFGMGLVCALKREHDAQPSAAA